MSFKENINQSSERLISSKFLFLYNWALQVVQTVKNLPVIWETWVQTLGWEDLLEKGMGGLSTILAWRIPWIEDPGKLKLIGLQRVGPFLTTFTFSLFWYNALFYSFITYLSCFLILLLITRDQITKIHWIVKKAREFQKNIYFCFIDDAKAFDCVYHNKLWKILKERGIPDHLTCLLRNLYTDNMVKYVKINQPPVILSITSYSIYKIINNGDHKQK